MSNPIVSLCIPTNGNAELVEKVLMSIYAQGVENSLFEVVIADNDPNPTFSDMINKYIERYNNIIYKETNVDGFLNQTEAYKIANGRFLKFINHRMILLEGALKAFINIAEMNEERKPVIYFSNGELNKQKRDVMNFSTFDSFIFGLSYWSSWSAGISLWKEDINLIIDEDKFNELFPHTNILFMHKDKDLYIIDNNIYLYELPRDWGTNGTYDLFHTFSVEYPSILLKLYQENSITLNTFLKIVNDNFEFLSDRYLIYILLKKNSTFNFNNYKESISVFYSMPRMRLSIVRIPSLFIAKIQRKKRIKRVEKKLPGGKDTYV